MQGTLESSAKLQLLQGVSLVEEPQVPSVAQEQHLIVS